MAIFEKSISRDVVKIATISAVCFADLQAAKIEVPVFLFSGQSNMVGLGTKSSELTAAQKKYFPNDNIKVYENNVDEGDASKASRKQKWLALEAGFGASLTQFGPELFFGKVLSDSFPGKKFAFIKVAKSGTYLGKVEGWLPPSSNNGTGGNLYKSMMTSIDAALKAFGSAFDTTLYTPKWAGFIWLQGEFDGWQEADLPYANKYEVNLTNLIKDIRAKTGVTDLPVILPMIDASSSWKYNSTIRAADVAVAKKLTYVDTTETKGLSTDNVHYKTDGMVIIGERCAARWLNMKYSTSSISYRRSLFVNTGYHALCPMSHYDLSGRMVGHAVQDLVKNGAATMVIDQGNSPKLLFSLPSQ